MSATAPRTHMSPALRALSLRHQPLTHNSLRRHHPFLGTTSRPTTLVLLGSWATCGLASSSSCQSMGRGPVCLLEWARTTAPTTQATESRQRTRLGKPSVGRVQLGDTDGKTKDRAPALGQHSRTRSASGQDRDSGAQQRTQSRSPGDAVWESSACRTRSTGAGMPGPPSELLEVLPVSGAGSPRECPPHQPAHCGRTGGSSSSSHKVALQGCAFPSMLTGCSLTCTVTGKAEDTCTAKGI